MNSQADSRSSLQIDIILCTYNRAHLIGRAIDSVCSQTHQRWHLLVVDDGSTDDTDALIQERASDEPRLSYLFTSHGGLARARNLGIEHCTSPFVTFIDSDDTYLSDHLSMRIDYLQHHPEIDLVHGGVELVGPEEEHYVVDARDPTKLIHISECCVGATLFGKREVFQALGGFRLLKYSSESDFLARAEAKFNVVKVDFPTYRYFLEYEDRQCKTISREAIPNQAHTP